MENRWTRWLSQERPGNVSSGVDSWCRRVGTTSPALSIERNEWCRYGVDQMTRSWPSWAKPNPLNLRDLIDVWTDGSQLAILGNEA